MAFNERLKEARLAAGFTGEKLGKLVGCSKQNISHWEAGRFEPNLTFLAKLCKVLDVPADWLLLDIPPPQPMGVWPFKRLSPDLLEKLSPEQLQIVEEVALLTASGMSISIDTQSSQNDTGRPSPTSVEWELPESQVGGIDGERGRVEAFKSKRGGS